MKQDVLNRIALLRAEMKQENMAYYIVPSDDYHQSEYVSDYFKEREYLSGFTGSAGTLVVSMESAWLWTDGRYFVQAEKQLEGTGIHLCKMGERGVPTISAFLAEHLKEGENLGADGRCMDAVEGEKLNKICADKQGQFLFKADLPGRFWKDRPDFPAGKVWELSTEYAGLSRKEKLQQVRKALQDAKATGMWLSKLDDLMWLFNLRGEDVECNPVALSHGYISEDVCALFVNQAALDKGLKETLNGEGIQVYDYDYYESYLEKICNQKILLCKEQVSHYIKSLLEKQNQIVFDVYPTQDLKACKNPVEQKHIVEAYLKDSVVLTKYIYWLKQQMKSGANLNEISAAEKLDAMRAQIPGFLDLSFPTICGYGPHGAIVHYGATPETCADLEPRSFVLIDSGGQYYQGTTDVTRTIALGELTAKEKEMYTAVAAGMLQLSKAVFPEGCTGRNLDILARTPLWEKGLDYRHGTGHGIGFCLNVHEGPQNIRWKYVKGATEYLLKPGMLVSDEPGVYLENEFGIRIENIVMVLEDAKTEYGNFMRFEMLTMVPLERDAIDVSFLTADQVLLVDAYQKLVYDRVSPYLNEEEKTWLYQETRPLMD